MRILAIETSCDETAIAIVEVKSAFTKASAGQGKKVQFKILGNNLNSQIEIHAKYGGVFPMMAKREHQKNLPIVFEETLRQAKTKIEKIDLIAVTSGPGLEPALWTGIVFAKELNKKYKIPVVPVNHMEGHIFSTFPKKGKTFTINPKEKIFPTLSLLVSGGHTELVLMKNFMKYKKLGQTRDDAVGEAFDKVARMLGLPYPGGPEIGRLASIERENVVPGSLAQADGPSGSKKSSRILLCADGNNISSEIPKIVLPRPMMYSKDYDFSFSGLKTAVLYMIRDIGELTDEIKRKIAREFEDATTEVLIHKTIKAIKEYKIKNLIVGGGVSASKYLQEQMKKQIRASKLKVKINFPSKGSYTDNALMIAIAGYFQYKNKKSLKNPNSIKANGNLSL
jgi:N6-L-threonylcarbamoyladenine synthase